MVSTVTASSTQAAAENIGELVNASAQASAYTAKRLRIDGQNYWVSPGRGVRNAALTSSHLVNLLLALGCGIPVKAVETVSALRGMLPDNQTIEGQWAGGGSDYSTATETFGQFYPALPGDNFGQVCDWIVETLADPGTATEIRRLLHAMRVLITIEPSPSAKIVFQIAGEDRPQWETNYWPVNNDPVITAPPRPIGELQRVFYGATFEALAKIWNDTKASAGLGLFPIDGREKAPHKENAALQQAAPSNANPLIASQKDKTDTHAQRSSLDTCKSTARVCLPSSGIASAAFPSNPRRRSHDRAHHDAAA